MRRLAEVCRREKPGEPDPVLARLGRLSHAEPDAAAFERLLRDWLLVERAMQGSRVHRRTATMTGRPVFPAVLAKTVRRLESSDEESDSYRRMMRMLGRLIEQADGFEKQFAALFGKEEASHESLVDLCLMAATDEAVLSRRAQGLVARVISKPSINAAAAPAVIRPFAHGIAGRTDALEPTSFQRFQEEFVDKERNLNVLIASGGNEARRQAVSRQLMEAARKTPAADRFLELLLFAARSARRTTNKVWPRSSDRFMC